MTFVYLQTKHERLLKEEKELTQRGLEVVSRLKNWYNERLQSLETRQKFVGRSMIPLVSRIFIPLVIRVIAVYLLLEKTAPTIAIVCPTMFGTLFSW